MTVLLGNKDLWEKFREHQTEMIITKEGRRMHPVISLKFQDLNPRKMYAVMIDFVCADDYRYCFDLTSNRWAPWRQPRSHEDVTGPRMYLHPETPRAGDILMRSVLTFKRLKLTNSYQTATKTIQVLLLNTMRRYFPRIHLIESVDGTNFDYQMRKEFCFPETEFIAVSSYRNKQITKLKIDSNPFASAYRSEGLHGKAKRLRMEPSDDVDDEEKGLNENSSCNGSGDEDNLSDNREEHHIGDNSSPNDHSSLENSDPSQTYDEQQLNDMQAVLPFLKDRLKRDVSFFVYKPANSWGCNRKRNPDLSHPGDNQLKSLIKIKIKSRLSGRESGQHARKQNEPTSSDSGSGYFDSQNSLFHEATEPGNASQTGTEVIATVNVGKMGDEISSALQGRYNRRKKYLPRKLQRANDLNVEVKNLRNTARGSGELDGESCSKGKDVVSSKLQDESENSSVLIASSQDKIDDVSLLAECSRESRIRDMDESPLLERFETADGASVDRHTITGKSGEESRDSPRLTQNDPSADLSLASESSALTLASTPQETADFSLNALIQMCSKAEGSLNNTSYHPGCNEQRDVPSTRPSFQCPLVSQLPGETSMMHFAQSLPSQSQQRGEFPKDVDVGCFPLQSFVGNERNITCLASGAYETHPLPPPLSTSSTEGVMHNVSSLRVNTSGFTEVSGSGDTHLQGEKVQGEKNSTSSGRYQVISSEAVKETPFSINPIKVNTGSSYRKESGIKRIPEYRPIAPAPNQSLSGRIQQAGTCGDHFNDDATYPVIIDIFSLNGNTQSVAAKNESAKASSSHSNFQFPQNSRVPPGNNTHFIAPNSYETNQSGNSGLIALDSTVSLQALSLEKFYSFTSAKPRSEDHEASSFSRFRGTRHYKTTRTNFSRLSLEPLCSVIYPLTR